MIFWENTIIISNSSSRSIINIITTLNWYFISTTYSAIRSTGEIDVGWRV